jgi:glycosyltransferase involved in cell wall biosynthesis
MSEPTFSIVITAYEVAGVIGPAVESALNQTRPADEVLVVDDGSEDDLEAALAPFEGVKLVRKENGGGASARNAGVAAASGEFMAILDADDAFHPRRIEAVAELARQRPELDLIATDARFVVDGQPTGTFFEDNGFPDGDQRAAILANCFPTGWPTVRISALRAAGGFDERMRIAYDWECWLRMILAGSEVGLVPEPLYDYVLHGGSLASSRVASLRERVVLLEKASANPNLRAEERPKLEAEIARRREEYARAAIGTATVARERRELTRLARSPGLRPRTRLRAALSALAPGVGRRLPGAEPPPERRFAGDPARPASA